MNKEITPRVLRQVFTKLRESRPLVLCLTNDVVRNFTANVLLASHAVPAMLADPTEATEMVAQCADALLVNVGTWTLEQETTMRAAVDAATLHSRPWVLDPVAAGLLSPRTALCRELIRSHPPTLIRGNAAEILALVGEDALPRGPESTVASAAALEAARHLARSSHAAVLVTGEQDFATDGTLCMTINGGHPVMTRVTGVGCAMGAVAAAFCAVADSPLQAAVLTSMLFSSAGSEAASRSISPGSFALNFLDALDFFSSHPESLRYFPSPTAGQTH